MKLISLAAFAALLLVFNNAQATVYTGCLTMGGNVNKVVEGIEKWEK